MIFLAERDHFTRALLQWGIYMYGSFTPVAGPILHKGNLSPNLKVRFCKMYPADFSITIHLFVCSSLSGFFCVSVQKSPPRFFQKGSGAFPAAPSARAFDASTYLEKAPRHCTGFWRCNLSEKSPQALCTSKAILDFHCFGNHEFDTWIIQFWQNR